jgi:hypothetical protein
LSATKGTITMVEEHYAPLRRTAAKAYVVLAEQFLARFPEQVAFLEGLVAQHKLNPASHLRPIMELATLYESAALERAFAVAHEYTPYSHGFVRGLLESANQQAIDATPQDPAPPPDRGLPIAAVRGDLAPYQRLLEVTR